MLPNSAPDSLTPTNSNFDARFFLEPAGAEGAASAEETAAAPTSSSRNLMTTSGLYGQDSEAGSRWVVLANVILEQDLHAFLYLQYCDASSTSPSFTRRCLLRPSKGDGSGEFIWGAGEPRHFDRFICRVGSLHSPELGVISIIGLWECTGCSWQISYRERMGDQGSQNSPKPLGNMNVVPAGGTDWATQRFLDGDSMNLTLLRIS